MKYKIFAPDYLGLSIYFFDTDFDSRNQNEARWYKRIQYKKANILQKHFNQHSKVIKEISYDNCNMIYAVLPNNKGRDRVYEYDKNGDIKK